VADCDQEELGTDVSPFQERLARSQLDAGASEESSVAKATGRGIERSTLQSPFAASAVSLPIEVGVRVEGGPIRFMTSERRLAGHRSVRSGRKRHPSVLGGTTGSRV